MEFKVRFTVDVALCERAADELYAILKRQELAFVQRLYARRWFTFVPVVLSMVGMAVAGVGLALCVWLLAVHSFRWWLRTELMYSFVFVVFVAIFYSIFRFRDRPRIWSLQRADNRAQRRAEKLISKAKRLAPYEAEFDLKGDLLTYTRGKEGEWKYAWHKKLGKFRARGLAVQGDNVTVIFRRPTSTFPAMVILQESPERMREALAEIGVTMKSVAAG